MRKPEYTLSLSTDKRVLIVRIPIEHVFESMVGPTRRDTTKEHILSARENQVFDHLRSALQDKEIADKMCLSVSAVKHHVSSILRKMGLQNRTEILRDYGKVAVMKRTA